MGANTQTGAGLPADSRPANLKPHGGRGARSCDIVHRIAACAAGQDVHVTPSPGVPNIVVTIGGRPALKVALEVQHTTVYRYSRPVAFGPHRLMLRPRDGHDLRLLATELEISPASTSKRVYDVLGNSVTIVTLLEPASELRFASRLTIERVRLAATARRGRAERGALPVRLLDAGPLRSRPDAGAALYGPADRAG